MNDLANRLYSLCTILSTDFVDKKSDIMKENKKFFH
jgi:hypothetical protein